MATDSQANKANVADIVSNVITDNIDTWTSAVKTQSASGRGSRKKLDLYGIKKLRELILELAVRGKLVPQDPSDEPASVLLKRIAEEKAQLVKDKKIKKQRALPSISDEEKPFALPNGWEWSNFDKIGDTNVGLTYSPKDAGTIGTPVLRSSNIQKNKIELTDLVRIKMEIKESAYVKKGDLLICARNGSKALVGKTALIKELNEPMAFGAFMAIFRSKLNRYLEKFINSPVFRRDLDNVNTTTINQITQGMLRATVVPIPPEKEQRRIVAKVDELMLLCDQLEQETESSIDAHKTLVETLLTTLTNSTDSTSMAENWARISEHFDTLFTTEHSIDQLKQTVLQLAVMGKLVPQDPTDEPASVLLERIAAEKAQLVADKKIKKQKALPPITDEEKPFELSDGWEWVRFGVLSNEVATGPFGTMIHKRDYIENGIPLINPSHMINSVIQADLSISVSQEKANELSSYKLFTDDIVMARRGEMGRCALVTEQESGWLCGTGSFVLRFNSEISREYLLVLFKTQYVKQYLGGKSIGTTMTNLNHGILNKMPFPIPPLKEQFSIIKRIEFLSGICEQLKASFQESQQTQLHLADAIVNKAV